jgi:hypothetical protein
MSGGRHNNKRLYRRLQSLLWIVRGELGKRVEILNPHRRPSRALLPHIDFIKPIRAGVLQASQFPSTLTDARGRFTKPVGW